jgi:myxalamid-type polyketide synthase MxaE and MxaD
MPADKKTAPMAVAIVGIGCRFPGAEGPDAFFEMLLEKTDGIREVPKERWALERVFDARPGTPGRIYTKWGGFLNQAVDAFDARFFGISAREATQMDPQQRLLLEVVWEALEDAGCPRGGGRTGVYVGGFYEDYEHLLLSSPSSYDVYAYAGAMLGGLAGRISHALGLDGPSMVVDTACSSSLVAVHLACQALATGETEVAIAAGANLLLIPESSMGYCSASMLSPDGRCKPFDARANGTIRSDGVAAVILKPLDVALRDGDAIYAVIRGSAVNHDGRNAPFMTPSEAGQLALLRAAYAQAGIAPDTVRYVEAHGTGTLAGDPVEARALASFFGDARAPGDPLWIGSVKGNIGHTEAAAGLAGLVKAALALRARVVPPTIHFEEPNPRIAWGEGKLEVVTAARPWPEGEVARAGVNSFGITKTNAHAVLEEPPRVAQGFEATRGPRARGPRTAHLLTLSARSPEALTALAAKYEAAIDAQGAPATDANKANAEDAAMEAFCATAARRRAHHEHRIGVVGSTRAELVEKLRAFARGDASTVIAGTAPGDAKKPHVAFVFSGQGSQWAGMARGLMAHEPAFREAFARWDEAMRPYLGSSLTDDLMDPAREARIEDVDVVQPLLVAVQASLAATWQAWGVEPRAVVGHSLGEVAAAHVAGALDVDDAARIACVRSRLFREIQGLGAMLSVELGLNEARALLRDYPGVSVACCNGPRSTVLSGDVEPIRAIEAAMQAKGLFCRAVKVNFAAHSHYLDRIEARYREALADIRPRPFDRRFASSVVPGLGADPSDGAKLDAGYWWKNMRETVFFVQAATALLDDGVDVLLEVSPHPVLSVPLAQLLETTDKRALVVGSLRRKAEGDATLLASAATLHAAGVPLAWDLVTPEADCARTKLPTYAWQRERFWMKARKAEAPPARAGTLLGSLQASPDAFAWTSSVALGNPLVDDHRVQDAVVFPAVGHLALALEAAREAMPDGHAVLTNVTFARALSLADEEPVTLHTELRPAPERTRAAIRVHRHEAGETASRARWTLLAHADVEMRAETPAANAPIVARPEPTAPIVAGPLMYARLGRGHAYGPAYQAVQEVTLGARAARARLATPAAAVGMPGGLVHPSLVDGCLQLLVLLAAEADAAAGRTADGRAFLPVAVRELWVAHDAGDAWTCDAVVHGGADDSSGRTRGDLVARDASGRVVFVALGATVQRSVKTAPKHAGALYRVVWSEVGKLARDGAARDGATPDAAARRWLVVDPDGAMGGALAAELGGAVTDRAGVGEALARSEALGVVFVAPRALETEEPVATDTDANPGVGLDAHALEARALTASEGAAQLAVALAAAKSDARLFFVTRGRATPGAGLPQPGAGPHANAGGPGALLDAPISGLARVVQREHPALFGAHVDVDEGADAATAARAVAAELRGRAADDESEIALRNGRRFVPRMVREAAAPRTTHGTHDELGRVLARGTYLVTGGLGGLGLVVAGWLADRGARSIALLGRSAGAPRAEAARAVSALEARGVTVTRLAADVADEHALRTVLADLDSRIARDGLPPLRGVVHAAGTLADGTLGSLDASRWRSVFAPKVAGAWALDRALGDAPLDFFVLFSSVVPILGLAGQANYAAANAFLDALAHHRRARGLAAQSIAWGPWSEVGLVASPDRVSRLALRGVRGLTSAEAVEALDDLVLGGRDRERDRERAFDAGCDAHVIVARVDWDVLHGPSVMPGHGARGTRSSILAELVAAHAHAAPAPTALTREELALAQPAERITLLEEHLRTHVARAIGVAAPRVAKDMALVRLGVDSLMAIELVGKVHKDLGVTIPAARLLDGATLEELARTVAEALRPPPAPSSAVTIREADASGPHVVDAGAMEVTLNSIDSLDSLDDEALLERLDELSPEEVATLLAKLGGT